MFGYSTTTPNPRHNSQSPPVDILSPCDPLQVIVSDRVRALRDRSVLTRDVAPSSSSSSSYELHKHERRAASSQQCSSALTVTRSDQLAEIDSIIVTATSATLAVRSTAAALVVLVARQSRRSAACRTLGAREGEAGFMSLWKRSLSFPSPLEELGKCRKLP